MSQQFLLSYQQHTVLSTAAIQRSVTGVTGVTRVTRVRSQKEARVNPMGLKIIYVVLACPMGIMYAHHLMLNTISNNIQKGTCKKVAKKILSISKHQKSCKKSARKGAKNLQPSLQHNLQPWAQTICNQSCKKSAIPKPAETTTCNPKLQPKLQK